MSWSYLEVYLSRAMEAFELCVQHAPKNNLFSYIDENQLDEVAFHSLFMKVLRVLQRHHEDHQAPHCAIHPGNIVVNDSGEPQLLNRLAPFKYLDISPDVAARCDFNINDAEHMAALREAYQSQECNEVGQLSYLAENTACYCYRQSKGINELVVLDFKKQSDFESLIFVFRVFFEHYKKKNPGIFSDDECEYWTRLTDWVHQPATWEDRVCMQAVAKLAEAHERLLSRKHPVARRHSGHDSAAVMPVAYKKDVLISNLKVLHPDADIAGGVCCGLSLLFVDYAFSGKLREFQFYIELLSEEKWIIRPPDGIMKVSKSPLFARAQLVDSFDRLYQLSRGDADKKQWRLISEKYHHSCSVEDLFLFCQTLFFYHAKTKENPVQKNPLKLSLAKSHADGHRPLRQLAGDLFIVDSPLHDVLCEKLESMTEGLDAEGGGQVAVSLVGAGHQIAYIKVSESEFILLDPDRAFYQFSTWRELAREVRRSFQDERHIVGACPILLSFSVYRRCDGLNRSQHPIIATYFRYKWRLEHIIHRENIKAPSVVLVMKALNLFFTKHEVPLSTWHDVATRDIDSIITLNNLVITLAQQLKPLGDCVSEIKEFVNEVGGMYRLDGDDIDLEYVEPSRIRINEKAISATPLIYAALFGQTLPLMSVLRGNSKCSVFDSETLKIMMVFSSAKQHYEILYLLRAFIENKMMTAPVAAPLLFSS